MQTDVDMLTMEVKSKETNVEMSNTEKDRVLARLKSEEGTNLSLFIEMGHANLSLADVQGPLILTDIP